MSAAEEKLIRQTLLDEARGDLPTAFALACARLKVAIHGASFAYLRRMSDEKSEALKLDDPPPVDDGEWVKTGRES